MTGIETIESIAKMPSGAILTDENRYDQLYLITIANKFRAAAIRKDQEINKRINPISYQRFYPTFVEVEQYDWCFYRFKCPQVINLDGITNGFRFIGTINSSQSFDVIKTRGELATFKNHPILNPASGRNVCALYDGTTGYWEIYSKGNKNPKHFVVEMIMHNPLDCPEYNFDYDQYPISADLVPLMEQMIYESNTVVSSATIPDLVSDSMDMQPQQPRSKRK